MNLEEKFTEVYCRLNHQKKGDALEILRAIDFIHKIVTDKVCMSKKRK